jgi:hypothetical protein
MNQYRVSDTCILQLGAMIRVHLTYTSESSKESHGVHAKDCGTAAQR